ncbi:MAG: hypothetical protein C4527_06800 [Candidatus Omnitrophota bacterium]|nr:MAG: hypothetical protein C4527_06800 [Candidatus Omnitrophota bacterium]
MLGFYHPHFLAGQAILEEAVVRRLGAVSSALQAAAANEIANLSISAAGTQYFFGRDRMFYVSESLGTYFIEPPWTTGAGNGSVGINTSYLDFRTLQGRGMSRIFDFYNADGDLAWQGDYCLTGQLTTLSMAYGVMDRLDLGLIVPLVYLDGEGKGRFARVANFPDITDFNESITDVADIFIRAKYEILEIEDLDNLFSWSAGVDVKLNNGDSDELLGTGDVGVRLRTSVGKRIGRFYPVVELAYNFAGVDAVNRMTVLDRNVPDAVITFPTGVEDDDFNAFEIRCGLPVALIAEKWTLSMEWMHSNSSFAVTNDWGVSTRIKINDQFFVQGGVRIPLDDEGLRTDFIPTIGCEYRF